MTKTKINKIIYWVATLWLALGMVSTGIVQLAGMQEEEDVITDLGYPVYIMSILGIWKILGVVAVLLPSGWGGYLNVIREWAYAGFFFAMSGALVSHIIVGHGFNSLFGPALLLVLTVVSWFFRPTARKIITFNH